jgi:hypothetical protein
MGDFVDHRGNVMPAPGNGRPKRPRLDKNDNLVAENLHWYNQTGTRVTADEMLTGYEIITTSPATLSATVPISLIKGTLSSLTLANGTYVGQRKLIVHTSGSSAQITTVSLLNATAPITLTKNGATGPGSAINLIWINDGTSSGWVVVGTSIREASGVPIANAEFKVQTGL